MKHTPNTKRKAPVTKWAMIGLAAAALSTAPALKAQSNVDGAIAGSASGSGNVVAENQATGVARTVKAAADGSFRIGSLPPGTYTVTYTDGTGVPLTQTVEVTIGTTSQVSLRGDTVKLDALVVEGDRVNPVDFQKTEATSTFSSKLLTVVPVAQNVSAVALLAPGTTQGDTAFGNLISFGGASVAENAYFINGFNVSNFRNGLDPSGVPYEFYDQFEVKTGSYSAEFGRSTGGVINATTKSGTNKFSGGVSIYYLPASLRSGNPDIYYKDGDTGQTLVYSHNSEDRKSERTINIYGGGPLWRNKLFFFGIYSLRNKFDRNVVNKGQDIDSMTDNEPFWGGKIDFYPFRGHHLEYTAFSDKSKEITDTYAYDYTTRSVTDPVLKSQTFNSRGGLNQIARYTGTFFEGLTLKLLYGKNRADKTSGSTVDAEPGVYDTRYGAANWMKGNPDLLVDEGYDEREARRIDLEYAFSLAGTHLLRAGYDSEDNLTYAVSKYTGGIYWRIYDTVPGTIYGGGAVPNGVTEVVREQIYTNGGGYSVKSNAWYLEDNWTTFNDRLLLRLGLRNESFENLNATNDTFIKMSNQLAPRIGVSYDLFGDKKTKVFANFGRYHLPVASNTNIRLAGAENFTRQWYEFKGFDANGLPIKGNKIGNIITLSDGTVKDRRRIVDQEIDPMYQDEWAVGVQQKLSKNWTVGIRGVYRDLKTSMDDIIVDHALAAYAARKGITNYVEPDAHEYVLANPGQPITYYYDIDGNGTDDKIELTPQDLGFDAAKRKYVSGEVFFERLWDDKWQLQGSYTWSQSYGNTEGWVKSDNGQDDAGITSDFDAVGLAKGTYGFLPNDRRHQFKAFGSYAVTKRLQVGLNARLTSGRPINRFGVYPESLDPIAASYENEAYWIGGENGTATSRGDNGRTPWIFNLDLSVLYKPAFGKDKVTFGVNVYNVLNRHTAAEVVETWEDASGAREWTYGLPSTFQAPIRAELFARFEF